MLDLPARISDSLLMLLHAQRVLAHLVVDDAQNLVQAGGHLDHYGLRRRTTPRARSSTG